MSSNEDYFLMHSEEIVKTLNELIIKIRDGVNDSPRDFIPVWV